MKRTVLIIQLTLLLQTTAVLAGEGTFNNKAQNHSSHSIPEFNTLSNCFQDANMDSFNSNPLSTQQSLRSLYPGYSFNLLKRPLYAININHSCESLSFSKA